MSTSATSGRIAPASRNLKDLMRKYPLFSYFLLSFIFSWIIVTPYLLSIWSVLPGDYVVMYSLKQWVGPALAGIIMTRVVDGNAGLLGLRLRIRQWRVGWQWYLFILLVVPMLILLGVILQPGALTSDRGFAPNLLSGYLVSFVAVFFGVGLPEEIGWRGFALPRMQQSIGPLWSSLLLGVVWAFWHLLYFLTPHHGGGPGSGIATLLTNFSIFLLMVIALAIVFTWVFNETKGSVLIASLLHTAIDTPQLVWVPLFLSVGATNSAAGEFSLSLALLIVFGVLAALIIILTRGQLGYKSSQE